MGGVCEECGQTCDVTRGVCYCLKSCTKTGSCDWQGRS